MTLTYGELCAGYGGLFEGVRSVLGGDLAWYSEFDPAPSKVMAHHHPNVPNIGDMTKVDWHSVPKVDVLTGGTPCQDLSHAGKRAGMTEGTRSNLWVQMREAINAIRPRLVVWENVRGALSAEAASELEPCPGCMGDPRDGRVVLRALGRVVGDLASLGYVGSWHGLRAADVGAPHGRFRVFLFATPADAGGIGGLEAVQHDGRGTQVRDGAGVPHQPDRDALRVGSERDLTLLPTPVSDNSRGLPSSGTDYQSLPNAVVSLLPTPSVHDRATSNREHTQFNSLTRTTTHPATRWGDYAPAIARWEALTRPAPDPTEASPQSKKGCPIHADSQEGRPGEGLPDVREAVDAQEVCERTAGGPECIPEAESLLPVVREHEGPGRQGHAPLASPEAQEVDVRDVRDEERAACASRRQEPGEQPPLEPRDVVRELPPETPLAGGPGEATDGEPCTCKPRLSPKFCEWLMGLPEGHVTDPAIGLTRNQQLKALGNGVVPAQAAAATRTFIHDLAKEPAA